MRRSMIRQLLLPARDFVLDLMFPPRCGGCRKLGWGFCSECADEVVPAAVTGGWETYVSQEDTDIVLDWRLEELGIERLCAAGEYRGALRNALVKLKYGNGRYLAPWLGRLLAPQLVAITGDGAALLSVPLHAKQQEERGYNQSLLARGRRPAGRARRGDRGRHRDHRIHGDSLRPDLSQGRGGAAVRGGGGPWLGRAVTGCLTELRPTA